MSSLLRGYRRTHSGKSRPLEWLRDFQREHGTPTESEIRELANELKLPPADIRGAISFYTNLHEPPDTTRVCRGTSCLMAGAESLFHSLSEETPCTGAYCLGYCDRSPVVLPPDGRPRLEFSSENSQGILQENETSPAPPDIRSAVANPIITQRIGKGDHASLSKAVDADAYVALRRALNEKPEQLLAVLEASGERGRGGAAFPTGLKWRTCAEASGPRKYVIANGDEGDPGSFVDRVLMEMDPHAILEGMALCAFAIGAEEGIVFIRSEYPAAARAVRGAIDEAVASGFLGDRILDTDFNFRVSIFTAMGSYVCGEETAMLNAIEGFRGEVRLRPPYPAEEGLYGCPTVVDNVETLVNIPWIVRNGAEAYRALGTEACSGTKAFCLNHGFARPGIVEVEFGTPLCTVIEELGGGGRGGQGIHAVVMGGPMGSIVFNDAWDVPVCYDAMAERGLQLGHAGLVALPPDVDWEKLLLHWLAFMQDESCGKCVPCRLGSQRALEVAKNGANEHASEMLERLFGVIEEGSLCAFGKLMPGPMRTILAQLGVSK